MLRGWIDAVRRNHGVEHATVAVLFSRTGPQRIAGRASADGFFILGSVDDDDAVLRHPDLAQALETDLDGHGCGVSLTVRGG